jgi:hypothetical protein
MQKVRDNPDLVRIPYNGALINTNNDQYYAAIARKRKNTKVNLEVQTLRSEVAELKSLIKDLINRNNEQ